MLRSLRSSMQQVGLSRIALPFFFFFFLPLSNRTYFLQRTLYRVILTAFCFDLCFVKEKTKDKILPKRSSFLTRCKSWNLSKQNTKKTKNKKKQFSCLSESFALRCRFADGSLIFRRGASFKEDEGTWKGNDDGKVVNNQPQRVMDDRNGLGPQGGYIAKITNDAREGEMEENMGQVNTMIGNLRNMAIDMGSELENQNRQIDRINRKVRRNDDSRVDECRRFEFRDVTNECRGPSDIPPQSLLNVAHFTSAFNLRSRTILSRVDQPFRYGTWRVIRIQSRERRNFSSACTASLDESILKRKYIESILSRARLNQYYLFIYLFVS